MQRTLVTVALTSVFFAAALQALPDVPVQEHGARSDPQPCRPVAGPVPNPDLGEGSGVAASQRNPGLLWAHNDSGRPELVKLDEDGSTVGRVRIAGAEVDDWEDIAVGPCAQQSCLYIADIGDNDGRRRHVTVYRVPEPSADDGESAAVDALHASYPDGPTDAESLFVTGKGDVYIITKGDPGPVALYRFPQTLRAGAMMRLERVGQPLSAGNVPPADRPTGADASPDGQWIAVRTTRRLAFYRGSDLIAGRWREAHRQDLGSLRERRGEGVAFGRGGLLFLVGESAGSRAGSFAKLSCAIQ